MPCGVGKAPGGTCSRLKCVGLWPSLIQTACCRVITRQPDLQTFALQHTCLREGWESANLTMGTTWQLGRTTERLPTASPHQLLQQRWHGNCILAHFREGWSCQRQWEPRNIWILLLLECLSRMSGRLPRGRGNTVASTPDTIAMPRLPSTDLCKPWKQSQNRPSFCTNPYFKLIPLGAGQRPSGQPRTQPLG